MCYCKWNQIKYICFELKPADVQCYTKLKVSNFTQYGDKQVYPDRNICSQYTQAISNYIECPSGRYSIMKQKANY